jgi:Ca-activated chloride channel family protein
MMRLLVLTALALALALPTLQSPRRGKTVVLAVDVSASIDEGQLAAAQALVRDAARAVQSETGLDREDRTRLRLVTYAGSARAQPVDPEAEPNLSRETGGGLASDHAGALRLAEALLDPDTEGRVVLVTDGAGSVAERSDLAATARELQARGLTLHTRSHPPAARGDVLVEAVHLPAELRVGQTFDVVVDLWASAPTKLRLRLDKDGAANPLAPVPRRRPRRRPAAGQAPRPRQRPRPRRLQRQPRRRGARPGR